MTGGQIMVVLVVAMVMIASIIKSKHGHHPRSRRRDGDGAEPAIESAETVRLREEVARLKDRVIVLERIATDKNHLLEQEFDRLRNS